jgi:hypothetical protein
LVVPEGRWFTPRHIVCGFIFPQSPLLRAST